MYVKNLESVGFKRGVTCGVVFYHRERDIALAVHGDDFTATGNDREIKWFAREMGKKI